ncbi:hypothetical protein RN001_005188 [Aquatica leii]|uniref:Uncharacterized protein n=1 Tax=Aquatica leii TaxID=1421715 RepID=A0AAN7Q063_9COLE|nr:hypothetical protein RN001_005188 [Aquatica leii]
MVQIVGNYKLQKNEKFAEYLAAMATPEEIIKKVTSPGVTTELVVDGNTYMIKSSCKNDVTMVLNQEVDELLPTGVPIKNIAKKDGNTITVNSSAPDGRKRTRIYEFTDEGYTVTLQAGDVVAKRYFVRA